MQKRYWGTKWDGQREVGADGRWNTMLVRV